MRKLAHIETISWLRPIEGADKIELAGILGWQCIVKKGEFKVGDLAVYVEIDSIMPADNPDFAFLEPRHYKIKTMKMRGVVSQGIIFPLSVLHDDKTHEVGEDVTDMLKIKQIEDDIPMHRKRERDPMLVLKQRHKKLFKNKVFLWFMRFKWFKTIACKILSPKDKQKPFPDWIVKTDETRLQNMPFVLDVYKDEPMIVTEKLDGTSTSFGLKKTNRLGKYDFAVCSRNVRQEDINQKCFFDDNVYHQIAKMYDVKTILTDLLKKHDATTVVLQGETIGEAIQKNKYGVTGIDFYAFNLVFDGEKIDSQIAKDMMIPYGIKWVPILETEFKLLPTVNEMIDYADGKSELCDTLREGVVIRDHNNAISFKCISNQFLLKHNL